MNDPHEVRTAKYGFPIAGTYRVKENPQFPWWLWRSGRCRATLAFDLAESCSMLQRFKNGIELEREFPSVNWSRFLMLRIVVWLRQRGFPCGLRRGLYGNRMRLWFYGLSQ